MYIIDINGSIFYFLKSKALILFKLFYNMLSLKAGEYIKVAVTRHIPSVYHPFYVYVCVCVCVCVCRYGNFSTLLLQV